MPDNMKELYEKFDLEIGDNWAGGYGYRCKKCHCATYCEEGFFPCQDKFIPLVISCKTCKIRWKLEIIPDDTKKESPLN